jgi:hypothetical protein
MLENRWSRLIPTRRRVVVYIAVFLGILAVRLAIDAWAVYRLHAIAARLTPIHGSLDIASLAPPAVKPADNRARILAAAATLTVVQSDPSRARGELGSALFGPGLMFTDPARRHEILRRAVDGNRMALGLLDEAESRPKANWEITYRDGEWMRVPPLMDIRDLSRVNVAAGLLDLEDGNADGAVRRTRLGLVLAGSLAQEPSLIVQLIGVAVAREQVGLLRDILIQGSPTAAALESLAPQLEDELARRPMVVGLTGELKYINHLFEDTERGREPGRGESDSHAVESAILWAVRPAVRFAHAGALARMDQVIAYARLQPFERVARKVQPPSGEARQWWWQWIAAPYMGGEVRSVAAGDEQAALSALAATALAVRRYQLARGTYPAMLDALVPAFLARLPIDPFTGRPLEYKAVGKGFELRDRIPPKTPNAAMHEWKVPR